MGKVRLFMIWACLILYSQIVLSNCQNEVDLEIPFMDINGISNTISNTGSLGLLGSTTELEEVCILLRHGRVRDLDVYLTAPSGITIHVFDGGLIADNNNAIGDNLGNLFSETEVCFTMDALLGQDDFYGSAIGDWLPAESFAMLDGEDPNGDWSLTVTDTANPPYLIIGEWISWSLAFSNGDCNDELGVNGFDIPPPDSIGFTGLGQSYCLNEDSVILEGYPEPFFTEAMTIMAGNGFDIPVNEQGSTSVDVDAFDIDDVIVDGSQISLNIEIDHAWLGDVSIYLTGPCGETVVIIDRIGVPQVGWLGSPDSLMGNYSFSNTGLGIIPISSVNGLVPEGEYLIEGNFDDFIGCSMNGEWTLDIYDAHPGSFGILYNWEIIIQQNFNEMVSFANFSGPGIVDAGDSLSTAIFYPDSAGVGTHEIVYTYLHTDNIFYADTQYVTVFAQPNLAEIDSQLICVLSDSLLLSNFNPADSSGTTGTYSWYSDSNLLNGIPEPSYIDQSGIYFVEYISDDGCIDNASIKIDYFEEYTYSISADGTFCESDSLNLIAVIDSIEEFVDVVEYFWSGPNGFSSQDESPTVAPDILTNGDYTLQVSVNGCMQAPVEVDVSLFENPSPILNNPPQIICGDSPVVMFELTEQFDQHFYSFDSAIYVNGGDNLENFIELLIIGDGSLTVAVIDDNGCSGLTETFNFNFSDVNPPQFGDIEVLFCDGRDTATYQLQETYDSYEWDYTNAELLDGGGANDDFITLVWGDPPLADFSVSVFNENNCMDSIYQEVQIYDNVIPQLSDFDISVCELNEVTYTLTESYQNYNWEITGGTIIAGGGSADSVTVSWDVVGEGTIMVTVVSNGVCDEMVFETLNVTPGFELNYAIAEENVCFAADSVLYQLDNDYETFDWTITGGTVVGGGDDTSNYVLISWNLIGLTDGNILVHATDSSSCENTLDLAVNIYPDLNNNFIPFETELCELDTSTIAISGIYSLYDWTITGGDVLSAGGVADSNVVIVWTDPTDASIELSMTDSNACQYFVEQTMTVHPLPEPVFDNPLLNSCPSEIPFVYELTEEYEEHYFTISGGSIVSAPDINSNEISVIWFNTDIGTIEVSVINENGCEQSSSIEIDIEESSFLSFEEGVLEVCSEEEMVVYTLPDMIGEYQWTVVNGTIVSPDLSDNSILVDWDESDGMLGLVYAKFFDDTNCVLFSDTLEVTIHPLPTPDFAIISSEVCAFDSLVMYQLSEEFVSYQWIIDGGLITSGGDSVSNFIEVSWNASNEGQVEVMVFDENGCQQIEVQDVVINQLPQPILVNPDTSLCEAETAIYTLSQQFAYYEWTVVGGEIKENNGQNILVEWGTETNASGMIYGIVEDANGCTNTFSQEIVLTEIPEVVYNNPILDVCVGPGSYTYELANDIGTYTWSIDYGNIISGGGPNDTSVEVEWFNAEGIGYLIVEAIDGNSCTILDSLAVNVQPLPAFNFIDEGTTFCQIDSVVSYNLESDYESFVWEVTGGQIIDGGGMMDSSVVVDWDAQFGVAHEIKITAISEYGCENEQVIPIQMNNALAVNLTDSVEICPETSVQLFASGGLEYTWNADPSISNENIASPFVSPMETTTYTVVVSDGEACIDSASVVVTVLPVLTLSTDVGGRICQGESWLLSGTTAENEENLFWEVDPSQGEFTDAFAMNPVFIPAEDFIGTATLTLNAENDCQLVQQEVEVIVEKLGYEIEFEEDLIEVCAGDMVDLRAILESPTLDISWSGGNESFGDPLLAATTYQTREDESGIYELTLTLVTGCETTTEMVQLIVNPHTVLYAGLNQNIEQGESVELKASGDLFDLYVWAPQTGLSCTDCPNPIANPLETTTYTVSSSSGCGEEANVTVFVSILKEVKLPNAFSPNGDGLNDDFKPFGFDYELVKFTVLNRYGQIMFTTNMKDTGWDGTFKGQNQPTGVYTYFCEYIVPEISPRPKLTKGNVTLVR